MFRAKMSSADMKKVKRRKTRKPAKSAQYPNTLSFESVTASKNTASMKNLSEDLRQVLEQVEEIPMPPNGMIQNLNLGPLPAVPNFSMALPTSPAPVPFMGRDSCLLCQRERPEPAGLSKNVDSRKEQDDDSNEPTPLPLWVCPECQKTVEEEERRGNIDGRVDEVRLDAVPTLPIFPDLTSAESPTAAQCNCEACVERRQIEAEHVKETQELQQCWMELRHVVRCVYREAGTGFADNKHLEELERLKPEEREARPSLSTLPDVNKMKELVHRLCSRDPHQLYQRLESQGREYVIEMKVRMLQQLTCGHKTPAEAKQFVSMLLDEYANLCYAAETLASFLAELETEHLQKFSMTWEIHNKHLYQSIIYSDPVVQNSLPELMSQLQKGREPSAEGTYDEETYTLILQRYLSFDNDMTVISVAWRDCQQLLDNYNDEQAALKAKQKMLKEDWEFFKAQRKLLEQQVLKNKDVPLSPGSHLSFEAHFAATMRHVLSRTNPTADKFTCPSCNRERCPCDECTISHMITCGIISPDVTEQVPSHHHSPGGVSGGVFPGDPSRFIIDVTPPTLSSRSSSSNSGSSSPIAIDAERLVLPFEDAAENFDFEDDIPEEIGVSEDECLSDKNEAMAVKDDLEASCDGHSIADREGGEEKQADSGTADAAAAEQQTAVGLERTAADGVEDLGDLYDDDDLDDDVDDGTDGEFGDDEEEDDDDDIDESDDEEFASGEDNEPVGSDHLELDEAAMAEALRQVSLQPELSGGGGGAGDTCDCNHCAQAKFVQQQSQATQAAEASTSQCQCHACVQASDTGGVTTSLPHPTLASPSPSPAALHLYPHIHGANNVTGLHAASAGHHVRPLLQPHLYELHNPLLAAATTTTSLAATTTAAAPPAKQQHSKTTSTATSTLSSTQQQHQPRSSLNLDIDSHEALHEHIYHAYGDWDNSNYDTTKMMLAAHKFNGAFATELLGSAPPLMTGNPFLQDGSSLGGGEGNLSGGADGTGSMGTVQFNALASSACTSGISAQSGGDGAASCSIAAAFADAPPGPSTCAASALFHSSVTNHHSANSDHVHTDACFKNMKALPASSTGSRMLFNSNQSVSEVLKAGSVLAAASSGGSSVSQPAAASGSNAFTSATSLASLATGVNLPLSEHCLKHNPFLHTHHASFSPGGAHTSTISSSASCATALPAHPPLPMKLTSELIRSVAMKEGAGATSTPPSLVTSQPVSGGGTAPQPLPSTNPAASPHTCAQMHGGSGASGQLAGQHNLHSSLLDPNSQAHTQSLSAAMANAFNSGAGGINNTFNNNVSVGTSTGCEAGCDGHHDDQYDSVDDSCSEQSSSTSASNQKDGKYCDCCYCEFFGHSNPPQAPTSRNYAEMRDRLRLRLKKKNEQKTEKFERVAPKPSLRKEDMVDRRGLDELIKFINGAEDMGMGGPVSHINEKVSGKAAKRQRQKQRKFEEKLRKDREELERKAREEAEKRLAAEAAERQRQRLLQQQQEEAERAAAKGKNKKKGKHKDSSPNSCGDGAFSTDATATRNRNGVAVNTRTKKEPDANGKNNTQSSQVSNTESKQSAKTSSSKNSSKVSQSSSQVNTSSKATADAVKRNALKTSQQHQQAQPVKPELPPNIASRPILEARKKPEVTAAKQEAAKSEAANANKAGKKTRPGQQQQPTACDRVSNTRSQTTPSRPSVAQQALQQQKGDGKSCPPPVPQQQSTTNGNGSKLGLNIALQATARALERKREILQKQKQQAEQTEGHQQAAAVSVTRQHQEQQRARANKGRKASAEQQNHHTPSTPTKQQRQQMLNNVMANMQLQDGHSKPVQGMRLPVQTPATRAQQITAAWEASKQAQVNGKQRQQHQMNGSIPMQHQQRQQLVNGMATSSGPKTPEKRVGGCAAATAANHVQKQSTVTPTKDAARLVAEAGGSATKMKKSKRKGKGVDDVEEIFKPKEDVDSDTGDMDDFERELEEFKRFCWDSAPPPQKEKVKVNVNLKDIFNKKGKQGVSCS